MIDPEFVRTMARYNAWQNKQLVDYLNVVDTEELTKDRGAFFGSILNTLNHLLWGDMLWLNRFDPSTPPPEGGIKDSTTLHPTLADWSAARFRTDGRITLWAERIKAMDLIGDMTMFSRVLNRETSKSKAMCVMHFFNHQTHHRGQIHAMLTDTGSDAPVSDLFFMPPSE